MERRKRNGWSAHTGLAFSIRALVFALPIAAAVGVSVAASQVVPQPPSWDGRCAWWAALLVLSTTVLALVDRQARRLLPLAVLLRLSLVFPDRVPSRWGAALRTGTTRQLRRRLVEAKTGGRPGETIGEAAARTLELIAALGAHDRSTRGHSERVSAYAGMIGKELGLSASQIDKLNWAALLHDIGKLGLPTSLLNKRGPLDSAELDLVRQHPDFGGRLVAPLEKWLGPWAGSVREHHERWDGQGYPQGLRGDEISLAARIVAVADAFDVMTAFRSYKRPIGTDAARRELTACAGKQFDPAVVRAMLSLSLGRMWPAMGPLTWLAQLPILGGPSPAAMPAALGTAARALVMAGAVTTMAPLAMPALYASAPSVPSPVTSSLAPATSQQGATPAAQSNTAPADQIAVAASAWLKERTGPSVPGARLARSNRGLSDGASGKTVARPTQARISTAAATNATNTTVRASVTPSTTGAPTTTVTILDAGTGTWPTTSTTSPTRGPGTPEVATTLLGSKTTSSSSSSSPTSPATTAPPSRRTDDPVPTAPFTGSSTAPTSTSSTTSPVGAGQTPGGPSLPSTTTTAEATGAGATTSTSRPEGQTTTTTGDDWTDRAPSTTELPAPRRATTTTTVATPTTTRATTTTTLATTTTGPWSTTTSTSTTSTTSTSTTWWHADRNGNGRASQTTADQGSTARGGHSAGYEPGTSH